MSKRTCRRRTFAQIRKEERAEIAMNLQRMALRVQAGRSPDSARRGALDHTGELAIALAGILKGVSSSIDAGVFEADRLWPLIEVEA